MRNDTTGYVYTSDVGDDSYEPCNHPGCGNEEGCLRWGPDDESSDFYNNGERDEYDDMLNREQNESDDDPPMFSVVGRVFYDQNTDKFSYYDGESGRVRKLSW